MLTITQDYSKSEIILKILTVMLWVNCFFAFFPIHQGSILWRFFPDEEAYNNIWGRLLGIFNFVCSISIIIMQKKFPNSNLILYLIILWSCLLISKAYNSFKLDFSTLIALPIEYLLFYIVINKYSLSTKNLKLLLPLLILWIVLPLFLLFFGPLHIRLSLIPFDKFAHISTYGGFALHRNFLGCYIGLILLLVLFSNTYKLIKIFVFVLGFIAIFLSASRSAIVCILLSLSIYNWYKFKKLRFPLLLLLICLGILYYILSTQIQIRRGDITDNSDRKELIEAFQDSISSHPILGAGSITRHYSPTYRDGSQAHNFLLQTWSDYGMLGLIFFCLYWGFYLVNGNIVVKVFISYIIAFGLFQPYFMLILPNAIIWVTILFICLVGGKNKLKPYNRDSKK